MMSVKKKYLSYLTKTPVYILEKNIAYLEQVKEKLQGSDDQKKYKNYSKVLRHFLKEQMKELSK
ncbi:hypothetical protein ABES25_13630 [Bacillus gobiensis]|uniref:hypothetical protein n=1 Tax=Bacillus gobiensis TaxID=1441095 RepID=UPI003D1D3FFA